MMKKNPETPQLTVLVPVFNEAGALPLFLPDLLQACEEKGWLLIVIDDGSYDATSQVLSNYENLPYFRVIRHKVNRGYGRALKNGILATVTSHVVTIDGDGQHSIEDIDRLFRFALEKDTDLLIGCRERWKNSSFLREFGRWTIWNFARFLMPLQIKDLNSGFKLYRAELVRKYLRLCPDNFAFSDIITLAFVQQRNLVLECPITIQKRKAGKSTVGIHTAIEIIGEIINIALIFNPLKLFLPLSALCLVAGIAWGTPLILKGRGVSVGAMLAILLGAIALMLGLVMHQLSAIRMNILEDTHPQENGKV